MAKCLGSRLEKNAGWFRRRNRHYSPLKKQEWSSLGIGFFKPNILPILRDEKTNLILKFLQ